VVRRGDKNVARAARNSVPIGIQQEWLAGPVDQGDGEVTSEGAKDHHEVGPPRTPGRLLWSSAITWRVVAIRPHRSVWASDAGAIRYGMAPPARDPLESALQDSSSVGSNR
jgi:hypothetical protein